MGDQQLTDKMVREQTLVDLTLEVQSTRDHIVRPDPDRLDSGESGPERGRPDLEPINPGRTNLGRADPKVRRSGSGNTDPEKLDSLRPDPERSPSRHE